MIFNNIHFIIIIAYLQALRGSCPLEFPPAFIAFLSPEKNRCFPTVLDLPHGQGWRTASWESPENVFGADEST